jgi:hypothetical protein
MLEVDSRAEAELEVNLYWDSHCKRTMIRLVDHRTRTIETFHVPAFAARDAFAHPYYYLGGPDGRPWD